MADGDEPTSENPENPEEEPQNEQAPSQPGQMTQRVGDEISRRVEGGIAKRGQQAAGERAGEAVGKATEKAAAGKAGKKVAGKAAGKAASTAGKTVAKKAVSGAAAKGAGAAIGTAVGGPLGTALGWLAGKLIEILGPRLIKVCFWAALAVFSILAVISLVLWGVSGGGAHLGSRLPIAAQQSSIDKFLAMSGDANQIRKLIIEDGDKLKKELENAKSGVDSLKISAAKKTEAKSKLDQAIKLIGEAQNLLKDSKDDISTAAREKIDELWTVLNGMRETLALLNTYGDFYLPLGSLTCATSYNRSGNAHTLAAHGHGLFITDKNGGYSMQDGGALDYYAAAGTPVYAITDGYLYKQYGFHDTYKNYILYFRSDDNRYMAAYAHITRDLPNNAHVAKGQVIGRVMRGTLNNPHLHFELWINDKPIKERAQLPYFCGSGI